jgi:4-amino-4-deoxy-L-arabinose transferase-like glycosyltransferase
MPSRRWLLACAAIATLALAIRLVYVFAFENPAPLVGDANYYHYAANLLADGKGFIQPTLYLLFRRGRIPAADHPPAYIVTLAIPSRLGLHSALEHQIVSCLLGTATVVVVAFTGRRIAGDRAGLIAATLAAVYPNIWISDGLVMSETLTLLSAAVTVLVAYRFLQQPSVGRAVALGVAVGVFALGRPEALLSIPLLVLPAAVIVARHAPRRQLAYAAIATGAALITLAPWVGYNLTRFDHPEFITTSFGWTMVNANCDTAYHGDLVGYWDYFCGSGEAGPVIHGDFSTEDLVFRRRARHYIAAHLVDVPRVAAFRVGRTFGFYRPRQQLDLDRHESGRPREAARVGLLMYYALLPFAVAGAVLLRRRKQSILPPLALVVLVVVTVAVTFGQTRYRAPAEVALVLFAAVAIDVVSTARGRAELVGSRDQVSEAGVRAPT